MYCIYTASKIAMKESFDAFEEKKYFLKEALKSSHIDKKTYEKMIKILDQKNEDLKQNRKNEWFWHSKSMKIFLWLLLFAWVALLFMNAIWSWLTARWWVL